MPLTPPDIEWMRHAITGGRVLDAEDLDFIDRALETWAAWSFSGFCRVGSVALYNSATEEHANSTINLSDDQLTEIDRAIAKLRFRLRDMVYVHYLATEHMPMAARCRQIGCDRDTYNALLLEAHETLYDALPQIEEWRRTIL